MTAVTFQSLVVLFVSGIAVGTIIDAARLMKDRLPYTYAKYVHLAVELLIWFGCGALTFYLLYRWQDGHWRFINFNKIVATDAVKRPATIASGMTWVRITALMAA